jgi:hypothetical protein
MQELMMREMECGTAMSALMVAGSGDECIDG